MRKLVTYYPSLLVFTLIIWPNIETRVRYREFPAINLAGFGVRYTEILFFFIISIWVLSILHNKSTFHKKRLSNYYLGNKYILYSILIFSIVFLQGIIFNNISHVLNDIRIFMYLLIIPAFQYFLNNKKYLTDTFKYICFTSSLLLICHFFIENTQMMYLLFLFIFSLSLSTLIISYKNKFILLLINIIIVFVIASHLIKWGFLGLLVIFTTIVLLQENIIRKVKIITISTVVVSLFILVGGQHFLEILIDRSVQDWVDNRVLRNGGDMSSGRFQMWSESFQIALQHPFWGQGIGYDFMPISRKIGFLDGIGEHSIIVYLMNRVGLISTIILLYFLFKFFQFCARLYKNERDIKNKIMILTSIGYITGYFAICTVENFWKSFETVIILYFLIAMISNFHLFKMQRLYQNRTFANYNRN